MYFSACSRLAISDFESFLSLSAVSRAFRTFSLRAPWVPLFRLTCQTIKNTLRAANMPKAALYADFSDSDGVRRVTRKPRYPIRAAMAVRKPERMISSTLEIVPRTLREVYDDDLFYTERLVS